MSPASVLWIVNIQSFQPLKPYFTYCFTCLVQMEEDHDGEDERFDPDSDMDVDDER